MQSSLTQQLHRLLHERHRRSHLQAFRAQSVVERACRTFARNAAPRLEYITLNYASGHFRGDLRCRRLVITLLADFAMPQFAQHRSLAKHHWKRKSQMQISLNAQVNGSNFDPSMSNQGMFQEAMSRHHHHHHCGGSDNSSNGQQGLSSEIQQLEQEIQSLQSQLSSMQSNGASGSSQSSSSGSGSMWGNIASDALMAVGMFL